MKNDIKFIILGNKKIQFIGNIEELKIRGDKSLNEFLI